MLVGGRLFYLSVIHCHSLNASAYDSPSARIQGKLWRCSDVLQARIDIYVFCFEVLVLVQIS